MGMISVPVIHCLTALAHPSVLCDVRAGFYKHNCPLPCKNGSGAIMRKQIFISVAVVAQLCLALCDLVDCSPPGSSVLHSLPEFAQIYVH